MFCIPKEKVKQFRDALKNKELNISDLIKMETAERTKLFEKFAGEEAKSVNTLFEQKLILKNKMTGLKNWASKVGEIGRYDPNKKIELENIMSEFKAKQQERMLSPKENETFLADLVEQKLGTRITKTEASTLFELKTVADKLKVNFDETISPKNRTVKQQEAASAYGAAEVLAKKYENAILGNDLTVKEMINKAVKETSQTWKEDKIKATGDVLKGTIKTITDNSIAVVASFDNSFMGRQGLRTLITHPKTWYNMASKSIIDFYKTLKGQQAIDAVWADVLSRPNYINGEYDRAKLIPRAEEQFPTSLPKKVPVVGRVFKASEDAFVGSAIRARIDIFDLLKEKAINNGVKWNDTQVKDNGKMISSLTSRGTFGQANETLRIVLWAPRMIKANWDILTVHTGGIGLETSFARKEAALNLVKYIGTAAVVMNIANAISPGSAEDDPTSSNFGKIKIGNTTFDYTGGAASLIVLAARLSTNMSKSPTTGIKKELGTGYGQRTRYDVFIDFLSGKTTPPISAVIMWAKGRNFQGEKPTAKSSVYGAFTPIAVQNAIELKDDSSVEAVIGVILDVFGINANTYQAKTDWGNNTGVIMEQFKDKVGDEKFKEANDKFNERFNDWFLSVRINPEFSILSDENKQKEIAHKKKEIKNKILREYNFHYREKKEPAYRPKF